MVPSVVFDFLVELSLNNNKEWFQANKEKYEVAKKEFEVYVDQIIDMINAFDPTVGHPYVKDCIFRIFRDIRYSKDKTPYKNNFGASIAHGGRKSPYAGYYLHIEPDNSFLGGGLYCPQTDILKVIRSSILENVDEYKSIIQDKSFKDVFPGIWGEKLKTTPKGFDKNNPNIDLVRYKSYTLMTHLNDEQLKSDGFESYMNSIFLLMKPYNEFMNLAIKNSRS
jgi:uncharacterized protein (TIGR02453 family)